MRTLLLFIFVFYHFLCFAQFESQIVNGIYRDRLTDDNGTPLSGITIQVQGKSQTTHTDSDGRFSIKADIGDVIVLFKNGVMMDSYVLDGSGHYVVNDFSSNQKNQTYLDSAKTFLGKDAFKSIDYVEKHFKSIKKIPNRELALGYAILGDNYLSLKQFDLAISNYQKSLAIENQQKVQINLAKSLASAGRYNESNEQYNKLLTKTKVQNDLMLINEGLGDNHKNLKQYTKALTYYQNALKLAEKEKLNTKITELNTKIAANLSAMGVKNESDGYLQKSLNTAENAPVQAKIISQNKVAEIYQNNRNFDKEIEVRKQTLSELEKAKISNIATDDTDKKQNSISISQLNLEIGRAYIDKKEFDKAIPYLEKSANKAKEIKDLEIEKNAVQKLSELYKEVGNSKKALEKYQEYAKIVDLLYQQKELEIQTAVSLSNDLRDKQNRINSLEKDRILTESQYKLFQSEQQLTVENYKRQKMLIYGLLGGVLLLILSVFALYRSNQKSKLANNLLALKSLRSQMNPHFIFNALNSVNNFISQNDERAANRYLTDFSTLMRSVLNNSEMDFISLDKEIELIQLYTQLEHSRFTDKFDYEIVIDKNLQDEQFKIPPMLIQPYVENAVWHGLRYKENKGFLKIEFIQKNTDTVQITITDDGIGRKKSKEIKTQNQKKQESKGMSNVKKRIDILNEMYQDKVHVDISDLNKDGSGTKVEVILKK